MTALGAYLIAGLEYQAVTESPRIKMITDIRASIIIPNLVEIRFGELRLEGGLPTEETALTTHGASLRGARKGIRMLGPDNQTAIT